MSFTVTLSTVLVMIAYSIPGYLLIRFKKISPSAISAFAMFLIYVCASTQILYALRQAEYSPYMLRYLGISFLVSLVTMAGGLIIVYLIFRKKQADVTYRICITASSLGNVGFIGMPLLQTLLPEYPQMQAFAAMFFLSLNLIMWTLGSWITTRDTRYISVKKIFTNPASIAVAIGLALFIGRVHLPAQIDGMIELLGRMATPMCMVVLGMRLATVPFKSVFDRPIQYVAVGIKLVLFPLLTLALCSLLPLDRNFVRGVYIISCVPVGNLVLSFAEMLGEGQDVAANIVLLSTILSVITIPVMLLII